MRLNVQKKYFGNRISGITGDEMIPRGRAHFELEITDSLGQTIRLHTDASVVDKTPSPIVIGNHKLITKSADFVNKTMEFNWANLPLIDGTLVIRCKQCEASKSNAVYVKEQVEVAPRSTRLMNVKLANDRAQGKTVCIVTNRPETYEKNMLTIPNSKSFNQKRWSCDSYHKLQQ